MGCGLASQTFKAVIMYCEWMRKNSQTLTDTMKGLLWYCQLYYGLHRVVMNCSFSRSCPELDLVASVGRLIEQWKEDLDDHSSGVPKAEAAKLFISQQLYQDTCTFCNGMVFLCSWWGATFPESTLRGAMLTQNVVENNFSQQRQAMGGGRNPDVSSVMSTMCRFVKNQMNSHLCLSF